MDKHDSDSVFPIGIGSSFVATLALLLAMGALVGFLVEPHVGRSRKPGGIPLLIIFLFLLVGPLLYNRKPSRFEKGQTLLGQLDGLGTVPGLRGAFFRLRVYAQGVEIRAFYHRHDAPFNKIKKISIEKSYFDIKIHLVTGIAGFPAYIRSSGKPFHAMALLIERQFYSARKSF